MLHNLIIIIMKYSKICPQLIDEIQKSALALNPKTMTEFHSCFKSEVEKLGFNFKKFDAYCKEYFTDDATENDY